MSFVQIGERKIHISSELDVLLYNEQILSFIIRKREIKLITNFVSKTKSFHILDCGCGTGWLTKLLAEKGLQVIGIDKDFQLLKTIKNKIKFLDFVICDAHKLPFRNDVFDCVIGVSILHHLNFSKSLIEINRTCKKFIFFEPNKLNFFSHVSRTLFPTETHTLDENPIIPFHLNHSLINVGYQVTMEKHIFCFVFPVARLLKNRKNILDNIIKIIFIVETIIERIPILRKFNSTIVIQGEK